MNLANDDPIIVDTIYEDSSVQADEGNPIITARLDNNAGSATSAVKSNSTMSSNTTTTPIAVNQTVTSTSNETAATQAANRTSNNPTVDTASQAEASDGASSISLGYQGVCRYVVMAALGLLFGLLL